MRYHFLDGLELSSRKLVRANAICRNLEAVFEEGDPPTCEDDFPQCLAAVFEMAIPSKRHEDVRNGQQQNRSHNYLRRTVVSLSLTLCNGQPLQNTTIQYEQACRQGTVRYGQYRFRHSRNVFVRLRCSNRISLDTSAVISLGDEICEQTGPGVRTTAVSFAHDVVCRSPSHRRSANVNRFGGHGLQPS